MKVKFLRGTGIDGQHKGPGDTATVVDSFAKWLIDRKKAIEVKPRAKAKAPKVEPKEPKAPKVEPKEPKAAGLTTETAGGLVGKTDQGKK